MAIKIGQEFERTSKATRFKDDVMTKAQMLACTDDNYSDGYLVVEKDSHDLYIYDSNATPSAETGKFVKKENGGGVLRAIRGTTTTTEIINAVNEGKNILVYWRQADENPRLVTKVDVDSPYLVYLSCTFTTTDGDTYAGLFTVHTDVETTWGYESIKLAKNAEIPTKTSDLTNDSNFQTDTEVQTKIDDAISGVTSFTYEVVASLPTEGEKGKIYLIENASQEYDEYIWMDGDPTGKFEKIGSVNEVDLSNYYNKSEVDTELAKKQNTLVSGTNIKTVNNQSLLGSGDIPIPTIVGSDWGVAKQGTVTVSGTTESTVSISDLNLTSASDYQVAIIPSANTSNPAYINKSVASFTVKIGENSGNKTLYYTIFAKGYGSVPNGGTTGQALVKKSNTDGDVEWKTVGGEDAVIIDVDNFNMSKTEFGNLFFSDKMIYIKDGYLNHLVTNKYTWDMLPEIIYELSYIEGNNKYTYKWEVSDDIYYRGKDISSIGTNYAVGAEKWYGTFTENGVTYQTYTKTVFVPALSNTAGITTYDHGISNIKQILGVFGFGTNGFVLNSPRQNNQDNIAIYQVSKSATNKTFSIEVGKDRSNMGAYITLMYAKNN